MSANNTYNFDVLVQISESELNDQLKAMFLSCDGGIPRGLDNFLIPGYLNFDMPTMELVDSVGTVKITLPVSNSQVTLPGDDEKELDGSIGITHKIEVFESVNSASIGLDFQSDEVDVEINIDQLSGSWKNVFKNFAHDKLSSISEDGRINLMEIPLRRHASDTYMPTKVKVTTVNSSEGNCLTIALQMVYDRVGDISQVNSYLIPNGHSAAIIINNNWLLGYVLRPQLAQELSVPLDQFDKPLKLNRPISVPREDGDDITLTRFEAKVVGEYIRVSGYFKAPITGPDMEVEFFRDINFEIDENGKLRPTAMELNVSIDYFAADFDVVEEKVKALINNKFKNFISNSYSLGALTEGFEIASVHIEHNLVFSADVISDDMPEDTPLISIQSSWTEADLEDSDWGPIIRIPGRFSQEVKWQGRFEALNCRTAFPIKYDWFFNEEALEVGEDHQINTRDGLLTYDYDLDKQVLTLKATSVGQLITGELCVKAVDGLDRELTDCININKSGSASRDNGGLNRIPPDIIREWVNPPPVDPMWQGKIDPDFVAKLMAHEGVTTLKELRIRLDLTQAQMAKRVGLSQADYAQFERGKKTALKEERS